MQQESNQWLIEHNIKAFVDIVQQEDFYKGACSLIQLSGIGKLRPNIIMLGFKSDWNACDAKSLLNYFNTIHAVFDYQLSIVIFHCKHTNNIDLDIDKQEEMVNTIANDSNSTSINITETETMENIQSKSENQNKIMTPSRIFLSKQSKGGYIDVWWLYDDGGLTLLLPYLVRSHSQWNNCKLRVFALANKQSELDIEQRNMATLLSKFRIDYSSVILITDILKQPREKSKQQFQRLIESYLKDDSDSSTENSITNEDRLTFTNEELEQFKDKVKSITLNDLNNEIILFFRITEIFAYVNCLWNIQ